MLKNFLLAAIFLARKPQRVPGWLLCKVPGVDQRWDRQTHLQYRWLSNCS